MRSLHLFVLFTLSISTLSARAQLVLEKTIPVTGMTDGFDHFAFDPATDRIFATAEDQGSVYVLSLKSGTEVASISGFGKPHSIVVRPGAPLALVIDSERSKAALISTSSFKKLSTVALPLGANALVYDPTRNLAIITAGGDRVGMNLSQVVSIDPATGRTLKSTEVHALHLQPMALDAAGARVFVSIADHNSVAVFDIRSLRELAEWKLGGDAHHHQPVAFDPDKHRLFVALDHPGKLVVVNTDSGKPTASVDMPADADDIVFDPASNRLIVPCGDGFLTVIDVFNPDHPQVVQKIPTGADAGTGIWLASKKLFILGVPKSGSMKAPEVRVFGQK